MDSQPSVGMTSGSFVNTYVGGVTTVPTDYGDKWIKNAQLSMDVPALDYSTEQVLHLGDSLTAQGGPNVKMTTPDDDSIKVPWAATNTTNGAGYNGDWTDGDTGDTNQQNSGEFLDAGIVPTFFRQLGKAGIFPYTDNRNRAQSGGQVDDAILQLSKIGAWTPTITTLQIGTNDALQLKDTVCF